MNQPRVYQAADQDGYDGGYIATDGKRKAWGETAEIAMVKLMRIVLEAKP